MSISIGTWMTGNSCLEVLLPQNDTQIKREGYLNGSKAGKGIQRGYYSYGLEFKAKKGDRCGGSAISRFRPTTMLFFHLKVINLLPPLPGVQMTGEIPGLQKIRVKLDGFLKGGGARTVFECREESLRAIRRSATPGGGSSTGSPTITQPSSCTGRTSR